MLVRWYLILVPSWVLQPLTGCYNSASRKLRLKGTLAANWCMLTDLWKPCRTWRNEARKGVPRKHHFTQTFCCSRGDSSEHPTYQGVNGHITHFVLPTLCQKVVFCSTKVQNSIMFSSESSRRRECIHSYILRSPSKGQAAGNVRNEYFDTMQIVFSWAVLNYDIEQQDGDRCWKPSILPLSWQVCPKTQRDPPKYIYFPESKIYSFRWHKYIQVYIHTYFCFKVNYANKREKCSVNVRGYWTN